MNPQMSKKTLRYTVPWPILIEEEVEGPRVTATCTSDDGIVCFMFDCTEALAAYTKEDIEDIFTENCFGCQKTDNLAKYYESTRTSSLFTYLDKNEDVGFIVELDITSTLEWLSQVHPDWLADLIEDGLVSKEEVQDIPLGLSNQYWDCECSTNYIHASFVDKCYRCGAEQEDQPDSRLQEIYEHYLKENV